MPPMPLLPSRLNTHSGIAIDHWTWAALGKSRIFACLFTQVFSLTSTEVLCRFVSPWFLDLPIPFLQTKFSTSVCHIHSAPIILSMDCLSIISIMANIILTFVSAHFRQARGKPRCSSGRTRPAWRYSSFSMPIFTTRAPS